MKPFDVLAVVYLISPVLMAGGKLFGINPFYNMPWVWITAPWWYIFMVAFTTSIAKTVWMQSNVKDSSEPKPPIRKDLH